MAAGVQPSNLTTASVPQSGTEVIAIVVKVAALLLVLVCYTTYLNAVPDYRSDQADDSFTYFELARGIQDGHYRTKHWMPGFPAALSVSLKIVGYDFQGLKLIMIGVAAIAAIASYIYYRPLFGRDAAFTLAILLMFVPAFFDYSHRVMSEIPCLAATMLCLACIEQLRRPVTKAIGWSCGIGLCLSAVIALAIRGNALALIPAMGVAALLPGLAPQARTRIRLTAAVAMASAIGFYGLWTLRNSHHEFSGIDNVTYLEEVQAAGSLDTLWKEGGLTPAVERVTPFGMVRRIFDNLARSQVYRVSDCVLPGSYRLKEVQSSRIGTLLAILLSLPVVVGCFTLSKQSPAGMVYLAGSITLIAVYPTGHSVRMLIPSLGLIVAAAYTGLQSTFGSKPAISWACVGVLAGAITCVQDADQQCRRPYSDDRLADVLNAIRAAEKVSQPADIVIMPRFGAVANAITSLRIINPELVALTKAIEDSEGAIAVFHETDRYKLGSIVGYEPKVLWSEQSASVVRFK